MGEDDGELRSQRGRNANSGCVAPKHRRIRPRAMSLCERTRGRDKTIVYHEPAPPLPPDHELVGEPCAFCHRPFEPGDVTKVVPGGPANEIEEEKARRNLPHIEAPPIALHYECGNPKLTKSCTKHQEDQWTPKRT